MLILLPLGPSSLPFVYKLQNSKHLNKQNIVHIDSDIKLDEKISKVKSNKATDMLY